MQFKNVLNETLVSTTLASMAYKAVKKYPKIKNASKIAEKFISTIDNENRKKKALDNKQDFIGAIKFALKDA